GKVDRDVVVAGALLHDVMKCYTYTPSGEGGYISSRLGEQVDHLTLLVAELYRRGFPVDVIHVAASHHGDVSPVKPKSVEALIVSIADLADSELSRRTLRAAEYLLRQAGEARPRINSSQEALDVVEAKKKDGWGGVKKLVDGED
ncbi:HDIG domain-containing protein, partial [Candidatus Bathyarchaeota archaeon]|nr:HDIG domain-containing protein [Candidatus Bathyarchaeota archaeon]